SSKLSAFFDDVDDGPSFPQKPLDDSKLSQYAAGNLRKSKREKEKEAAEAKRREEEADAEKAYKDFIDAFEGEDISRKSGGSVFVKSAADSGTTYAPSKKSIPTGPAVSRPRAPSPVDTPKPKPKGKRAMDSFLEEIKRDQAEREARYSRQGGHGQHSATAMAAYEGQSGSKDRGDPQTSNVFVANLPPNVTEQSLGTFFARAGPVGSVKIMWPRGDGGHGVGADMTNSRRAKNSGLSGFVSFMKRKDAEEALRQFDGIEWGGSVLRVGWSKAVPVAAKPLYEEAVTDTFIRAVAAEVKGHGEKYAKSLYEREQKNPKFAFLVNKNHRRHNFYKRLVESSQHLEPEFDDEVDCLDYRVFLWCSHRVQGYNSVYSTDSAEESERERVRKNVLGKLARKRFEAMLRAMSGKRGELARCMAFSLEHAEAAHEVADLIVSSLLVDGTPVPRKVARLHLICDILHNSAASVPSAWKFRQEFQARLGIVFDHMSNIYHSFPGRITAETFKKQITAVVDVWEDWIVFPPDFTNELRQRLEGNLKAADSTPKDVLAGLSAAKSETVSVHASKFKSSTFQSALPVAPAATSVDVDGAPLEDVDGAPLDGVDGVPLDDVDGSPLDDVNDALFDDVDGTPLDDVDGQPMDDVDGDPMDDVDGAPMDDVDGAAMDDVDG
ncbi:RNA-binding domain-containing protein, partial [Fistulina hepatica ATCC 64428]